MIPFLGESLVYMTRIVYFSNYISMDNKPILLLFFILFCGLFQSQKLKNLEKFYKFDLCSSPHTVVLEKTKRGKERGYILTTLENKKHNGAYKKVTRKSKINSETAKKILNNLQKTDIDLVNKTYDDDSLFVLDGDYLEIEILKNGKTERYGFEEIRPKNIKKETTPLRIKLQDWISLLYKELSLYAYFSDMKKKLNKGTYCYSSGAIYTTCFTIK